VAPTPHPSPLPREREPVFPGIDGPCSEVGTLASLDAVRKTPPCEPPIAREGNLSRGCMCRDQWSEEWVGAGRLRGDAGLQVHFTTASNETD
jgi:hypothetical protein